MWTAGRRRWVAGRLLMAIPQGDLGGLPAGLGTPRLGGEADEMETDCSGRRDFADSFKRAAPGADYGERPSELPGHGPTRLRPRVARPRGPGPDALRPRGPNEGRAG